MNLEIVFVGLLVTILLMLAVTAGWRQWGTLRGLPARQRAGLTTEDVRHFRNRAWRRLAMGAIMVALGGMLAGAYLSGLEDQMIALGKAGAEQRERGERPVMDTDQKQFLRLYSAYWATVLGLLGTLVALAAADLWAVQRHGMKHLKRIREDQREMLQQELDAYRRDRSRNGHP